MFSGKRLAMLGILFATVIGTWAVYPHLPSVVASHWGINGQPNGYMSRFWGTAFAPIFMCAFFILLTQIPKLDPKKQNAEAMRSAIDTFGAVLMLFFAYIQALILASNLGYSVNVGRGIAPAIGVLILAVAHLLQHAKPNWFFGIRTPWTLSDEIVWAETHKRGATAFRVAGALCLLSVFVPTPLATLIVLIAAFSSSVFTIVYSFIKYRELHP